jgi:hypothetical protein
MVRDSDLQSLSVVSMVFGDILIWCIRPLPSVSLPFYTPKLLRLLKINITSKNWKLCSSGDSADIEFLFVVKRGPWRIICTISENGVSRRTLLPVH